MSLLLILAEGLRPLQPRTFVSLLHVPHLILEHGVPFDFFVGEVVFATFLAVRLLKLLHIAVLDLARDNILALVE